MSIQKQAGRPMEGIRVIDCTTVVAGPLATQMLADQGADVIKIEPKGGDIARILGNGYGDGISSSFAVLGRNKRSLSLDLSQPDAVDIVRRLVADADIFITNTRTGVMEKNGLGFNHLKAINPKIVYAELTGFGKKGPNADKPAYDPIIQAMSGMVTVSGEKCPELIPQFVCDKIGGLSFSQAITAALFAAYRTGDAQEVHVSLLSASMAFLACDRYAPLTSDGREFPKSDLSATYRPWKAKDRDIVFIVLSDQQFASLARVVDEAHMIEDPRFGNILDRALNIEDMRAIIGPKIEAETADHWISQFNQSGIPVTSVCTDVKDLRNNEQVLANDRIQPIDHGIVGNLLQIAPAADFDGQSGQTKYNDAPTLGQHSREILKEHGYDDDEIDNLHACSLVF